MKLDDAIRCLQHERPSERTAGLDLYRQIFGRESSLSSLAGDDVAWTHVFQALFHCVLAELAACTRKGDYREATAVQLNKLSAASRTVRWLVERAYTRFERKTAKVLIVHLSQTVVRSSHLIAPIAFDYLKALRTLLSYPPHRNSIDRDQWTKLATLCLNAVMARDIKDALPEADAKIWSKATAAAVEGRATHRSLGLEDIEAMGCLEELMSSPLTNVLGDDEFGARLLAQYALFFLRYPTETTAHFSAVAGLNKLLRDLELNRRVFVDIFIGKTWAILVGLWESKNKALKDHLIVTFRILLPHLTAKVPTATTPAPSSTASFAGYTAPQMLTLLHRQLNADADNRFSLGPLPLASISFVARASDVRESPLRYKSFAAGQDFTVANASSWAVLELASDVVAHLASDQYAESSSRQSAGTDAERWAETGPEEGSTTSSVTRKRLASGRFRATENSSVPKNTPTSSISSHTASKRRKVAPPRRQKTLKTMLDALSLPVGDSYLKAQSKRLWNIQVLIFLLVRHWPNLHSEDRSQILQKSESLLNDGDSEVQSWAFICLGIVADVSTSQTDYRCSHIWTLSCRRIHVPAVSRAAAMAAIAILQSSRLSKEQYLAELGPLLTDLDISSPSVPHDSVANFFSAGLQVCSSDVRLSKKHLEEKVGWWLTTTWLPTHGVSKVFQSRGRVPEESSVCILRLLSQICRFQRSPYELAISMWSLPGSTVVDQIAYELETASIRRFLLNGTIGTLENRSGPAETLQSGHSGDLAQSDVDTRSSSKSNHTTIGGQHRSRTALESRCSTFLLKGLSDFQEEWGRSPADCSPTSDETAFADSATAMQARKTIGFAVISLMFDAFLRLNMVAVPDRLAIDAAKLLLQVTQTLAEHNRWSLPAQASLLTALQPLIQDLSCGLGSGIGNLLKGVIQPGRSSGVRRRMPLAGGSDCRKVIIASNRLDAQLRQVVWQGFTAKTRDTFTSHVRCCLHILGGDEEGKAEANEGGDDDDDWGRIKQAKVDSETMIKPAEDYGADRFALATSASLCISALVDIPKAVLSGPSLLTEDLESILTVGSLIEVDRVGKELFTVIEHGNLQLTYRPAAAIMTRLGVDYLPDYRFRQSEHAQLIVLQFLQATMELWEDATEADTDLAAKSQEFCLHFAKSLKKRRGLPWRVRAHAMRFFELLIKATVLHKGWIDDGSPLCASALAALICGMADDEDMRVRFAAAPVIARLFEICPPGEEEDLFAEAAAQMGKDPNHLEGMLSRSLTSADIMIASSSLRATSLFFLIEPCLINSLTNTHAEELLRLVARSLGFSSTPDMFVIFAAQLTFGMHQNTYNITKLPAKVLGYQSVHQCLEHNFVPIGSMMAAISIQDRNISYQLAALARSIRKTEAQGVADCLSFVLALELVFAVRDAADSTPEQLKDASHIMSSMRRRLLNGDEAFVTVEAIDTALRERLDQIILSLLLQYWEQDDSVTSVFYQSLHAADGTTADAYRSLLLGVKASALDVRPHEPIRPQASGMQLYFAIRTATSSTKASLAKACVYHVIQQMLTLIWRERLVNEQLRRLSALKLYVAMHADAVANNQVLLRTLLHGASVLMGQADLLHSASGVAHWCLEQAATRNYVIPLLCTSLCRMAEQAEAYASSEDVTLRQAGEGMYQWIEERLLHMAAEDVTQRHVLDAIVLFPRQLPTRLSDLSAKSPSGVSADSGSMTSLQTVTEALNRNPKASLNGHCLDRFHKALVKTTDVHEIDTFARSTIWNIFSRLRSCTTGPASTVLADVTSDILFFLKGRIKAPTAAQLQLIEGDSHLQTLESLLRGVDTVFGPIKAYIALQVLDVHRAEDLGQAERTLRCLRAIMSLDPAFSLTTSQWPPSTVDELQLLSAFPTKPIGTKIESDLSAKPLFENGNATDFDSWICQLASSLCTRLAETEAESFYSQVQPLMESIPTLAEKCFPALLHSLLTSEYDRPTQTFKRYISLHFAKVLSDARASVGAWTAIVTAVLYMRKQPTPDSLDNPRSSYLWLDIDFLLLSRRSLDAKMFNTALLFVELAREYSIFFRSDHRAVSEQLYEIFSNIEDPDSFYGIVDPDLRLALIRRLHHEGEWHRAFEMYAADHETEPLVRGAGLSGSRRDVTRSGITFALHEMGYNRLAAGFSTVNATTHNAQHIDFDVGWRTDDWDLPLDLQPAPGRGIAIFAALRALHRERDPAVIDQTVDRGLTMELRGLHGAKVEAIVEVRRVARDLLSLREVKSWRATIKESENVQMALAKVDHWPALSEGFAFPDSERILSVRQSFLRAERIRAEAEEIGDLMEPATRAALQLEGSLLLRLSKVARKRNKFQTAMNAVTMADKLNSQLPESEHSPELMPEFASVLWAQGEHAIAMQALQGCLKVMPDKPQEVHERARRAALMAQLGQWRATARSQQPRVIDEEFFRPAIALIERQKKESTAVFHQYAAFADEQYRALRNSNESRQLEAFVSHRQEEIRQHEIQMSKYSANTTEHNQFKHHRNQAQKICRQDEAILEQHEKSKGAFLKQAFKMYAAALTHSNDFDHSAVKLTSLWFENAENLRFNIATADFLAVVPVHKFLKMTHQLSSRLTKVQDAGGIRGSYNAFQPTLLRLMRKMCIFHPFHCLYAIFALRKADLEQNGTSSAPASRKSSTPQSSQKARGAAAHDLWNEVKASSPHKARIVQLEKTCFAYVEWAELDLKVSMPQLFTRNGGIASGRHNIPANVRMALRSLQGTQAPVATVDIAVDPSSEYRNITTIVRYSSQFETAGGLHLPKIIECIGSDGKRYKQLFKAQDDLRQDAVMQQVFTLLNGLLDSDQKASERELKIRTYIVLPLGPQCGLLEFVGNTSPIGNILVSTHEKYRLDSHISPSQARSELAAVGGRTPDEKLAVFRQVCEQMPPCFRFYFFEQYKEPTSWFSARLSYTRSVAATSIIGHALGIGDRHVSNILIDQVTGEVIHIDFGVAFEQGKLLPIPELVPFRLTRDMVDAMGFAGVEGVYRRCCEETLRVLRDGSDVIKTVLEVFKYDPLFAWTSNPVKVIRAQRDSDASGNGNAPSGGATTVASGSAAATAQEQNLAGARDTASLSAERAIGSVMGKLSSGLSTQYAVNQLIQTAQDEVNLSSIFHGWQPAL